MLGWGGRGKVGGPFCEHVTHFWLWVARFVLELCSYVGASFGSSIHSSVRSPCFTCRSALCFDGCVG